MIDQALNSFVNSPASVLSLLAILVFAFIKGWIMPISWVEKLLKGKDETIATQAAQLEQNKEITPLMVRLMEALNEEADKQAVGGGDDA